MNEKDIKARYLIARIKEYQFRYETAIINPELNGLLELIKEELKNE